MVQRLVRIGTPVFVLLLLATACRFGFDSSADEFTFSSGGDSPFGGAAATGLDLLAVGARLQMQAGFELLDEHLPAPVASASAAALADDFVVTGGVPTYLTTANCDPDVLLLDTAGGPLVQAGSLPYGKQGGSLKPTADGALLELMGYCNEPDAEEAKVLRNLQPAQDFSELGQFPISAYHFSSGVVTSTDGRDRLLVAGGYGCGPLTDVVESMTISDGSASLASVDLPTARCLAAGVGAGSKLYVFGGSGYTDCAPPASMGANPLLDEILAVGVDPDSVEVVARLPEPLADGCAVTRPEGDILVFGGMRFAEVSPGDWRREVTDAVYRFDPAMAELSLLADRLPTPRAGLACAVNASGRVVLFGGADEQRHASDEILAFEPYAPAGDLTGKPVDAGLPDARWTSLDLDADAPEGTSITVQVRISASPPDGDGPAWVAVTPGPLPADLPRGRFLQWRLELSSASPLSTPTVRSLQVRYTAD